MSSWCVARRFFCAVAEAATPPAKASSRWERLKNSKAAEEEIIDNTRADGNLLSSIEGMFCRSLLSDYKEACREIFVGAWERPVKASVYMTLLGGTGACFYTKPDQSSFEALLLERSGQLGLLSPWIRNATSDGHVQSLLKLHNEGRLRHTSLGVLSLVYRADYGPDVMLYEARCPNLSVPWRELPLRVLDIGFVGRWWILDTKMNDYDVNEGEFKNLPAHMQATSPPGVEEVERSERLHKESWLALTMEEEGEKKEDVVVDGKQENVREES